jgi:DNA-binding GntR family transcriptional regulator
MREGTWRPPTGRLTDVVYATLKARLVGGMYAPGYRLSAEVLRSELGVSRQPAMDALRMLAGEGLIRVVPQVGSLVASYDDQEIEDFFFMFGNLEGSITALAAARRTDDQVAALERNCAELGIIGRENDPAERAAKFRDNYREFHGIVHDMAHTPFLADTVGKLWDFSDFLINTAPAARALTDIFIGERHHDHDVIREAVAASDAITAQDAATEHIRNVARLLLMTPHDVGEEAPERS